MNGQSKIPVVDIKRTIIQFAPYSWILSWLIWPIVPIIYFLYYAIGLLSDSTPEDYFHSH